MIQGSGVRVWLLIVLVPGFGCGVWLLSGCSQASRPGAPGACVASDCAGTCSFRVDGAVRAGQVGAGAAVSLACRESLVRSEERRVGEEGRDDCSRRPVK